MQLKNMDELDSEKKKLNKNILDLLWKLTNSKSNSRIDACRDVIRSLQRTQAEAEDEDETCKDLQYCVERLVKGLASSRDAARLGFALLLTEILKQMPIVKIEDILDLAKKHLSFISKQEKRDIIFGQLFAYSSIVRSGRLVEHPQLSSVILSLYDLWQGKSYILNASYEIIVALFSQLTKDQFQESVWPHLKKKLSSGWEICTADSMWLLLLCIRMFPEVVTEKYLKKCWDATDILSADHFDQHKKMIRQTTACLPMLHPYCLEFLFLCKIRKDMKDIWIAVIDENLFEFDQSEKAYVGFEMIKKSLQDISKKKLIKCVLSPKFCTMFTKSYSVPKHPMNPAALCLASFLSDFVKQTTNPDIQVLILKVFIQPPGCLLSEQVFRRKEVSAIIQNLLPDAVKTYCELLKSISINRETDSEEGSNTNKHNQAIVQIGNLVSHPTVTTDIEWRLDVIKFLYLHSFFNVKVSSSDIPHCEMNVVDIPAALKETFKNAFYKGMNSLHHRMEQHVTPLEQFLQHLLSLSEYVDQLMAADEFVYPCFPLEKVQGSWEQVKSIVHKLKKQSKKDGKTNESNAFQALFLELGFHLFREPEHISEVLEELHICCKKALHSRKHPDESTSKDNEPPWVGVVVDILLSLLSKTSQHLRSVVTSVFPLLCPFITEDALQQILTVITPEKLGEEAMLVDESDDESDVGFDSGSSSDESDTHENDASKVDEEFKKKVKSALGRAAEISDAESVVLTDSEMFQFDDALAEAFRSRAQTGHTQLSFEDKTMLHFRTRCFDLIMAYLKSEPPMHMVLHCVEPILAAYEYGHKGKQQTPLLHRAVSTLQTLTRIKKFQHLDNVEKSHLKELLGTIIAKCHKETDMGVANKLYAVCVFMVLCFRKLEAQKSPEKKDKKLPQYLKMYLSALEVFVKGSSHMLPQFFVTLMEACPDLAWNFLAPCQMYAFDSDVRIYKRTQSLGLVFEALKFSKSQSSVTGEEWLTIGSHLIPIAVETLKEVLENSEIKPLYLTELLDVIYTTNCIVKEKTDKALLDKHADLLPLLIDIDKNQSKKLVKKANTVRRKLILALGGSIPNTSKKQRSDNFNLDAAPMNLEVSPEEAESETEETMSKLDLTTETADSEDLSKEAKSKQKRKKSSSKLELSTETVDSQDSPEGTESKPEKRKSESKDKKRKKIKTDSNKSQQEFSDS